MKVKKIISLSLALSLIFGVGSLFTACNKKDTVEVGTVRYLNFKPESTSIYESLAKEYEKETGVKVVIETAANNQYESTLASKMATDEAPTLFQINGPKGYENWKDYCADLSKTELYKHLTDKSLAVKSDGKVYGIPYVVEGYGIIYNKAITDKYFNLTNRDTEFKSMEEINNFTKLKALVEDIQKHKEELDIDGAFASTSLKSGEDWRWQTHLSNLPLSYEFTKNKIDLTGDATNRKSVGTKTVVDSMSEFALERCAFVQNGNWAWSQISEVSGNKVKAENIKYLPIYMGVEGEEKQGLCIGTENFYAINSMASEADKKASADFIYWLYSSDIGKDYVTNKLGFIAPFDTFKETETPQDPLAREVLKYMKNDQLTTIPWNFTVYPSQQFKENLGASLLKYAQGTKTFDEVKKDMVADWEKESNAANL